MSRPTGTNAMLKVAKEYHIWDGAYSVVLPGSTLSTWFALMQKLDKAPILITPWG
jgi:hypothetical protein